MPQPIDIVGLPNEWPPMRLILDVSFESLSQRSTAETIGFRGKGDRDPFFLRWGISRSMGGDEVAPVLSALDRL